MPEHPKNRCGWWLRDDARVVCQREHVHNLPTAAPDEETAVAQLQQGSLFDEEAT